MEVVKFVTLKLLEFVVLTRNVVLDALDEMLDKIATTSREAPMTKAGLLAIPLDMSAASEHG